MYTYSPSSFVMMVGILTDATISRATGGDLTF